MSGVVKSSAGRSLVLPSRGELQPFAQLPRFRRNLLATPSRASCFWSHTYVPQHRVAQIGSREIWRLHVQGNGQFSTSATRRVRPKDADKQQHKPLLDRGVENPPPKSLSAIRQTLKAKLTPVQRHEQIWNIPNLLTFSRLFATPVIGYLIVNNHHLWAFSLFVYAGTSDLLDGWIARKWNLQTVVGSVVDPMADKALMTTLVTCLAYNGTLPLPLATLILGRDISLAIAAIYYRYASLPAPKTFSRYWDFSLPSAEVHPTTVSKFNTFLQLGLIGTTMCTSLLHDPSALNSVAGSSLLSIQNALGGEEGVRTMIQGVSAVVAGTTIWSGLSYAWMKDAVKILGEDEELKRKQGRMGRMIVGGCFGICIGLAGYLAARQYNQVTEGGTKVHVTEPEK